MVIYIQKYDVLPQSRAAWGQWTAQSLPQFLQVPGPLDFSMHRQRLSTRQIAAVYSFSGLDTWSAWMQSEPLRQMNAELRQLSLHHEFELWDTFSQLPERLRIDPAAQRSNENE